MLSLLALQSNPNGTPVTWERDVIYQIFPRSFRDSNGDRIGDLEGIRQGLPYLRRLGVTAILLNPIARSRTYHNYFADDLTEVDPEFGDAESLQRLTRAAHRLRMKVVLDVEPQYVADGHPWLRAYLQNPAAPERAYLWAEGSWLWNLKLDWYDRANIRISSLHLNHPAVRAAIQAMFMRWSELGIDGYRLDHMMDDLDDRGVETDLLRSFWRPIISHVRTHYPKTYFIAEQADWGTGLGHIQRGGADAAYGFATWFALSKWDPVALLEAAKPASAATVNFIENHDVERFATLANDDPRRIQLGGAVLMALNGVPSVYYGQELGMRGRKGPWPGDGSDIPRRLAFEWSRRQDAPGTATWYAGTGPWAETGDTRDGDGISVEEQLGRPGSTLETYRRLIWLRRRTDELNHGTQRLWVEPGAKLFYCERTWRGRRTVFAANFSDRAVTATVPAGMDLWTRKKTTGAVPLAPYGFCFVQSRS